MIKYAIILYQLFLLQIAFGNDVFIRDSYNNLIVNDNNIQTDQFSHLLNENIKESQRQNDQNIPSAVLVYTKNKSEVESIFNQLSIKALYEGDLTEDFEFNRDFTGQKIDKGSSVFLLKTQGKKCQSSAPELLTINGKPFKKSGLIIPLIKKNDSYYLLIVKDKTKPVAMIPGGVQTNEESSKGSMKTAERELQEETNSMIYSLPVSETLIPIASVNFENQSLFGINGISDQADFYLRIINGEKVDAFNELDGKVKTITINNSEIDYIGIIPLNEVISKLDELTTVNFRDIFVLSQYLPKLPKHSISLLHLFIAVEAIAILMEKFNFESTSIISGSELKEIGLQRPSNIVDIKFFQNMKLSQHHIKNFPE